MKKTCEQRIIRDKGDIFSWEFDQRQIIIDDDMNSIMWDDL